MKPEKRFQKQPKAFWALVKLISEQLGYTRRRPAGDSDVIRRYTPTEIRDALRRRGLNDMAVQEQGWDELLAAYSEHRGEALEQVVASSLMDREEAAVEYARLREQRVGWRCPEARNLQRGELNHPKYLAGLVNMVVEVELGDRTHDCNPNALVTITKDRVPVRTLARRVDGAYPSVNDPYAIWEVKEFYDSKTFGSRVADSIYESMLDGSELAELRATEGIDIKHYLMMDARDTWWRLGRSYLCRAIDMLHDDLVDEVFFGRQVLTEWPAVVRSWPKPPTTS